MDNHEVNLKEFLGWVTLFILFFGVFGKWV